MAKFWEPDTCPFHPGCKFETTEAQESLIEIVRLCDYHAKQDAKTVFEDVRELTRNKNFGTKAAADVLGVEHAAVPWIVDANGGLNILLKDGQRALQADVQAAVDLAIGVGKARAE